MAEIKKQPASLRNAFFPARAPAAIVLGEKVLSSPAGSALKPVIARDGGNYVVAYRQRGEVTHVALIRKGHAHIIPHLANRDAISLGEFSSNLQSFILNAVDSADLAESAFNADEGISQFAARPMAVVYGNDGKLYLVCQSDARVQYSKMPKAERRKAARDVIAFLAFLHNESFVTGGLSPDAVVFAATPMVKNPAKLEAMNEQDSLLHEAAATLAMFNRHGEIGGSKQMESLAKIYLSMCVVGRAEIAEELKRKGLKVPAYRAIADLAMKYSGVL